MNNSFSVYVVLYSILVFPSLLCADASVLHTEHGAHTHDTATLNVSVEGSSLAMELLTPASQVVDMKLPEPKKTAEAKLGAESLFVLESGSCKRKVFRMDWIEHKPGHADILALFQYECANPQELGEIKFHYEKALQGIDHMNVMVVSPKGQFHRKLTPKQVAFKF